jgi:hypothetical protein
MIVLICYISRYIFKDNPLRFHAFGVLAFAVVPAPVGSSGLIGRNREALSPSAHYSRVSPGPMEPIVS